MFKPYRLGSVQVALGLGLGVAICGCSGSDPSGPAGGTSGDAGGGTSIGLGGAWISGGNGSATGGASAIGNGGANSIGGTLGSGGSATVGGSSNGGTSATGGTIALGGAATGGANAGGVSPTGGAIAKGGASGGGTTTGGSGPRGGSNSGGASTGGVATGGSSPRGGAPTGGANTGGIATGGAAIGGAATGGASTGTAGVRIVGRTATGTAAGSNRFSWPGVNIHATFSGTQVSMDVSDGSNGNRFTVVVDGGTPKTVTTGSGGSLSLASGLTSGTHDLVIWRNTEAGAGVTQFLGLSNFGTAGSLLPPEAAPSRRMEVIGDSISAGAGVEGTSTSCSPNIDAFTNNYLAYGSVAGRSVSADVVTIAWSGIGVYRNYDGSTANVMPTRYPYAIPNDATAWDFSKYQPHVVVINLGTNDFGSGDPGTAYETAYVNFVKLVRSKYASANFVLIDMYGGNRLTRINNVIATLKAGGESKVEMLSFSSVPNNNTACNQHPNTAAHAAMGALLATRLKSLMGW